jgi:hypothetical protein
MNEKQKSLVCFIALAEFYARANHEGFTEAAMKLSEDQLQDIETFILHPERDPERVSYNLEIFQSVQEIRSGDADC